MITWSVTLTPRDGSAEVTIQGQAEVSVTPEGNVLFEFEDLTEDYRTELAGIVANSRIEQYANRAGTYEVVSDPGCKLVDCTYDEVLAFVGDTEAEKKISRSLKCVVQMTAYRSSSSADSMSLLAYRADYRYERGTGVEEQ